MHTHMPLTNTLIFLFFSSVAVRTVSYHKMAQFMVKVQCIAKLIGTSVP